MLIPAYWGQGCHFLSFFMVNSECFHLYLILTFTTLQDVCIFPIFTGKEYEAHRN